jgi:hypothetical protein
MERSTGHEQPISLEQPDKDSKKIFSLNGFRFQFLTADCEIIPVAIFLEHAKSFFQQAGASIIKKIIGRCLKQIIFQIRSFYRLAQKLLK